ncbi:MAG TPA: helix-turn-helix transcriptional regulator [Polyangiaceae bacterium]|nr:helix-turn-helix transcriptional regulator [Polyangiaceae bacterium]
MPRNIPALLHDARKVLGLESQGRLGELLGSSQRSGQRWERAESTPTSEQLAKLAALVHPKDGQLAVEIAAAAGGTLEGLGVVRPAPAPPPAGAPDPVHIVDTVVCAAAEAMQLMPEAVRPALRAAFRRARLAGLSVEAVDAALSGRSARGGAGEGGGVSDGAASDGGRARGPAK